MRIDDSDEAIAAAARAGDSAAMEFLLHKYRDFVRMRARSYFFMGADHEDVIQEGMIGLYKAVRDFRVEKLVSFRAFAKLCIARQIITAIKSATRLKHAPLNQSVSLSKPAFGDDSGHTLLDIIASTNSLHPEDVVVRKAVSDEVRERMNRKLSDLESRVLALYLEGKSYQEMSTELNRHTKSIDNALQRLKRKLEKDLAGLRP